MATQSALWRRVRSEGVSTLAVMGMTKNTGKTVTLNHLLACAASDKVALGVTSIGRDGEARDQVFQFPKPPVTVWPGMLIATARDTLSRAKVGTKAVCSTGLHSPMGEIVIVRAQEHGEMEIAGASRSTDLRSLIARLQQCGCDLVVLDGALGRSHHASPAVADAVVLATGAAIGGGVQDVIRKTLDRLRILGIPQADVAVRTITGPVFAHGGVGLWDGQDRCLHLSNISTLNAAPTLMAYAHAELKTIAVSGAVGHKLWDALTSLAAQAPGLTLVVNDGTRLFVDAAELSAFARLSGQVLAHQGIRIAGVTVNPFAPQGGNCDAPSLLRAARESFAPYEVADVVLESSSLNV